MFTWLSAAAARASRSKSATAVGWSRRSFGHRLLGALGPFEGPRVDLEGLDRRVLRAHRSHPLLELRHGEVVLARVDGQLCDGATRVSEEGVASVDLLEVREGPLRVAALPRAPSRVHEFAELLEHEHLAPAVADLAPALDGVAPVVGLLVAACGPVPVAGRAIGLRGLGVVAGLLEEAGGRLEVLVARSELRRSLEPSGRFELARCLIAPTLQPVEVGAHHVGGLRVARRRQGLGGGLQVALEEGFGGLGAVLEHHAIGVRQIGVEGDRAVQGGDLQVELTGRIVGADEQGVAAEAEVDVRHAVARIAQRGRVTPNRHPRGLYRAPVGADPDLDRALLRPEVELEQRCATSSHPHPLLLQEVADDLLAARVQQRPGHRHGVRALARRDPAERRLAPRHVSLEALEKVEASARTGLLPLRLLVHLLAFDLIGSGRDVDAEEALRPVRQLDQDSDSAPAPQQRPAERQR
jgi:hypothetical protein